MSIFGARDFEVFPLSSKSDATSLAGSSFQGKLGFCFLCSSLFDWQVAIEEISKTNSYF